jgi:hypothetical protein
LGSYDVGTKTFSDGHSTLEDNVLTVDNIAYRKVILNMSRSGVDFLQLRNSQLQAKNTGHAPTYEQRVASIVVVADGIDLTNIQNGFRILAEVPASLDCSQAPSVSYRNPGMCNFTVMYRDSLDGALKPLPETANLSLQFSVK